MVNILISLYIFFLIKKKILMFCLQNVRRMGGGLSSWEGVFMGVICEEIFGWVVKFLAKTSSLRLGWGIE